MVASHPGSPLYVLRIEKRFEGYVPRGGETGLTAYL
jgi:hypothetical protein